MDLNTFKFVVELAESYIRECDMGAEAVMKRLRKVMDGYCQVFAIGDLVQLADGRVGKVEDQTELFYYVRMPGDDKLVASFPLAMKKALPTAEDVASDAFRLVIAEDEREEDDPLDECENCGKGLPPDPWVSGDGEHLFCREPCIDDFYCQGP